MTRQDLRDRNNNLIGYINTRSDGTQEGRDKNNNLKGSFNPKSNETRDVHNRLVGKGNMLSSLIIDPLR